MSKTKTIKAFSKFLSQLAERSEHVYWLSSPDLQTIQYISPAYEKIWGRELQELYENPEKWITFLHPEDAEHHHPIHVMKERIQKLGAEAKYHEDYRIIRPNGEIRWIMDRGFPIYDDHGNCLGVTGVALEVTKEKQAELALEKAKIQAETANRAKTIFLANISHDVITPLVSINMLGDILSENPDPKEKNNGAMIASCAKRLLDFFSNCLQSSNVELSAWESTEEVFWLTTMLSEVCELFLLTAKNKGVKLTMTCDATTPTRLKGQRSNLYRVVLNLVGNALKFTQEGSVTIHAFLVNKIDEEHVQIGIEVKDTGIGIPEDKQTVIFERLHRLMPAYEGKTEGHGIGLYIVDQYVKRMGGSITVKSQVNKGSVFTVTLPLKISSEEHAASL